MGRSVDCRFPPYTTVHCKISKFAKKRTSFPEPLIFLVFRDDSGKNRLYDMQAMHDKTTAVPRITKSNCPYVARPLNNIKVKNSFSGKSRFHAQ